MTIERVGVLGAGQMGAGIAQVCASAGRQVILCDLNRESVERGLSAIRASLDRLVAKEKLGQAEANAVVGRIETDTSLEALGQTDIVIEAATENEGLKQQIFEDLDWVCKPEAILATNTSSISITRLAAATARPEKVIGMHFMNPVPMTRLVEVIRGLQTSEAVFDAVNQMAKDVGKVPVDVKDAPGFVANRILLPMINEAVFCLQEGLASAEEIDVVVK